MLITDTTFTNCKTLEGADAKFGWGGLINKIDNLYINIF
jgi:hypothetical protein